MTVISAANINDAIPAKVYAVVVKYSQGMKWKPACEEVGIDPRTVKKYWKEQPELQKFYTDLVKESAVEGKNKIFKAFPKVAETLIKTATNPKERAYARNQAADIIFRYMNNQEINWEMRQKMEEMQQQLHALEGCKTINYEG